MDKTLLLVEDNVTIQTMIMSAFTSEGFEVIIASHAADGLQHLQTIIPDVVLADAAMPEIDGFQLCQIIRNTAHVNHVPVVLLTSKYAAYDRAKGNRVGVTAHLDKPFALPAIIELVKCLTSPPDAVAAPEHTTVAWASLPAAVPRRDGASVGEPAVEPAVPTVTPPLPPPPDAAGPPALPTPEASGPQRPEAWERDLLQTLQQTFESRLTHMFEQLTPQLLDLAREVVQTKVPELLEVLLQREIDKLKQGIEDEERVGHNHRLT